MTVRSGFNICQSFPGSCVLLYSAVPAVALGGGRDGDIGAIISGSKHSDPLSLVFQPYIQ